MAVSEQAREQPRCAKLRNSTVVFLTGDLEGTLRWYEDVGFESRAFPPGFGVVWRDDVKIFIQHHDGYVRPDDEAAREREAWDVYIETDDAEALFQEFVQNRGVKILRGLCPQEYGQVEFDIADVNGYRLVFAQPLAARQERQGLTGPSRR